MKPLIVNPNYMALVPRPTKEEYASLEANIVEKKEATEPIIINQNDMILDGHTRYEICIKHGCFYRTDIREFDSELDEKIFVIESNILRRHLSSIQKAQLAINLEPLYAEKAKQRQEATIPLEGEKGFQPVLGSNEHHIKSRDQAAKTVGLSPTTYHRAKTVIEKAPEELKKQVLSGETSVSRAYKEIKKIERKQANEELKEEVKQLALPNGKFEVIVIDPPWNYGTEYDPDTRRVASPYPEMSIEEIMNMEIPANEESCMLFMWTTNAFMHDAYHIIEKWGFESKTILTWIKDRMGIGYWLRGITEHVILAVKGKPKFKLTNQTTALHAKNLGHSIKPPEFYDFVDGYVEGRKLDYFARKDREGWETFGTMEQEK